MSPLAEGGEVPSLVRACALAVLMNSGCLAMRIKLYEALFARVTSLLTSCLDELNSSATRAHGVTSAARKVVMAGQNINRELQHTGPSSQRRTFEAFGGRFTAWEGQKCFASDSHCSFVLLELFSVAIYSSLR